MSKKHKDDLTSKLRSSIQASIDQAEAERRKEMFKRRLDLARKGFEYFKSNNLPEAIKAFLTYIKILEQWKKVPEGKLTPNLFDQKMDAAEMLLISGVYWDLAKLFDSAKSPKGRENFRHYLHQYIIFSKGMPFQTLSSETLRRFIKNENPKNKGDYKRAYQTMTGSSCFVVTSLMDLVEDGTLDCLRKFRDERLVPNPVGIWFVRLYYRVGPLLAQMVDHCPRSVRVLLAKGFDLCARFNREA